MRIHTGLVYKSGWNSQVIFVRGILQDDKRAHPHKSPCSVPERALASRQKQPSRQTHSAAAVNNTPRPEFHINVKWNPRAWQQSWRFPAWKFDTFSICNYYSKRGSSHDLTLDLIGIILICRCLSFKEFNIFSVIFLLFMTWCAIKLL